jgi:hypothetical protein
MNVADFLRSLLARPLACALIVGLALVAGVAGVMTAPRSYQSTTVLVIIPPGSGNPDAMMNPLVNLTNNMAQLAAVVATKMRTDGGSVATAAGGTGEFTVDTTFGDSPTFAQLTSQLVIQAKASNAVTAQRTTQALADYASTALQKIQADSWVPSHNNAVTVTSVTPQPGTEVSNSPIKSGAAYAFATILAGLILLIGYDGPLSKRRGNRSSNNSANGRNSTDGRDSGDHEAGRGGQPDRESIDHTDVWPSDEPTEFAPRQPASFAKDHNHNGRYGQ